MGVPLDKSWRSWLEYMGRVILGTVSSTDGRFLTRFTGRERKKQVKASPVGSQTDHPR